MRDRRLTDEEFEWELFKMYLQNVILGAIGIAAVFVSVALLFS